MLRPKFEFISLLVKVNAKLDKEFRKSMGKYHYFINTLKLKQINSEEKKN